jgi:hypothetical protein
MNTLKQFTGYAAWLTELEFSSTRPNPRRQSLAMALSVCPDPIGRIHRFTNLVLVVTPELVKEINEPLRLNEMDIIPKQPSKCFKLE